eukprot:7349-Heterococcus_DN1.PRE.1
MRTSSSRISCNKTASTSNATMRNSSIGSSDTGDSSGNGTVSTAALALAVAVAVLALVHQWHAAALQQLELIQLQPLQLTRQPSQSSASTLSHCRQLQ